MAPRKTIDIDPDVLSCCAPLTTEAMSDRDARDVAQIFGALSDPVRLRMLSLIASAPEVCSCALEQPLSKCQSTIAHHTRILAEAGLIAGEKRGRWTWWHVVPGRLEDVAHVLSQR